MNIVILNANGQMSQHLLEIKSILNTNNVDLLLVSETHFTSKTYFQISNYKTYHMIHPDGTTHGGSAILVSHCNAYYNKKKSCGIFIEFSIVHKIGYNNV